LGGGGGRVKELLDELGVRPEKARGQNFLMDLDVLNKQLRLARLTPGDIVLEVGAGLGVLTWELSIRARQVVSYESDPRLAEYLRRDLPENVDLREEDALKAEWPPFDKMVANVPYSISSPLLFKLLDSDYAVAVLLLQKEFADRLTAEPRTKAYGRLTVSSARLADIELLEVVPPTAFHPQPRVDSAIVRIIPQRSFPIMDEHLFNTLLRVVFSQRRKMLHNSLESARSVLAPLVDPDTWKEEIRGLECADVRPEELSPAELGLLADAIYEFRS
jgi:16S rRNA (adenine1518-N6/adenine1519-N6)-dimethyltransferase